jgi:ribosomal protein S18 acetylase RimI-like enzyme
MSYYTQTTTNAQEEPFAMSSITIRAATPDDASAVWPIFHAVVSEGETYPYAPETTRAQAVELWFAPPAEAFVALIDEAVVGTYRLAPNQVGLGDHIANAGFMVAPAFRGRGIASAMCADALVRARTAGFLAMQFNFVVSTNERAVALWKRHGFVIVGRVPRAFRHADRGLVDVLVMHRFL